MNKNSNNNYIKNISEPLYTKDDMIKEIEDIRKETRAYIKSFESAFGDPFSMLYLLRYIDEDIDNRISKLKGNK